MSDRDTCRYPSCDNPTRERGELQYPDNPDATTSDGERFRVSTFGARFCSDRCELRYEHVRADAQDARQADHDRGYRDEPHPEEVRQ